MHVLRLAMLAQDDSFLCEQFLCGLYEQFLCGQKQAMVSAVERDSDDGRSGDDGLDVAGLRLE
jgi:hypothetical protein